MQGRTTTSRARPSALASDRESWNLGAHAPLERDELAHEVEKYKATGDTAAAHRVVESHLRLVAKISRRYQRTAVPMDDLMAEGALALRRALDNFDPTRGASFTSYASVVIEHAVRSAALTHHDHFKIPTRERRIVATRNRAASVQFIQSGQWPTAGGEQSGADTGDGARTRRFLALPAPKMGVSLDAVSATGLTGLMQVADSGPSPLESVAARDDLSRIATAVQALPPTIELAIRLRFGIEGGPQRTVADVAREMRVPTAVAERAVIEGLRRLKQTLVAGRVGVRSRGDRGGDGRGVSGSEV